MIEWRSSARNAVNASYRRSVLSVVVYLRRNFSVKWLIVSSRWRFCKWATNIANRYVHRWLCYVSLGMILLLDERSSNAIVSIRSYLRRENETRFVNSDGHVSEFLALINDQIVRWIFRSWYTMWILQPTWVHRLSPCFSPLQVRST